MSTRTPLVFGDDGLLQQLQSGDTVQGDALACILVQNRLILKLLTPIYMQGLEVNGDLNLSDDDLNEFLGELS